MKAIFVNDICENIDRIFNEETKQQLKNNFQICDTIFKKDDLKEKMDAQVIFSTWGFPEFTEEEIDFYFPNLKIVFYAAGSVQYFAKPFLNKNIKIISSWQANGIPVAQYSAAQIMLANKGFFAVSNMINTLKSREKAGEISSQFIGNYRTKVGLLGAGVIGAETAQILNEFDLDIYVFDPFLSDERAKVLNVTKESLEYIFENCQTISNHLANNEKTVGILNYNLFKLMKPNSTFINTGRGAQVVEKDLIKALKECPTRMALLDVTDPEPPIENHDFYTMKNVILTPHMAGSNGKEVERMGRYALEESIRYIKNEPLLYEVTKKMLETMA